VDLRRGSPEASEGLVINAERVLGDVRAAGHLAGALGVPDAVRVCPSQPPRVTEQPRACECRAQRGSHRPPVPRASAIQRPSGKAPRRACGEIHPHAAREDHGEEHAGHRLGDDSPSNRPAARRARPDVQHACGRATKYPAKGVLHDLPKGDAGLRRTVR